MFEKICNGFQAYGGKLPGEIAAGSNVAIEAHPVAIQDIPDDSIVTNIPASMKVKRTG